FFGRGNLRRVLVPGKQASHQRGSMSRQTHPWGVPPWSADFRHAPGPLPDRVDLAIVGGGFTGLCAAAWLARLAPNKSVLVLAASALGEEIGRASCRERV